MSVARRIRLAVEEITKFHQEVEEALDRVERILCAEKKRKYDSRALVKIPKHQDLMLYNFKIWMMRYHISLDFILETLLRRWSVRRTLHYGSISFGIAISHLTSLTARKIIEEAVLKAFPTGENIAIMNQPQPRLFRISNFENTYQMIKEYGIAIEKSRRDFEQQIEQRQRSRRNYRKN